MKESRLILFLDADATMSERLANQIALLEDWSTSIAQNAVEVFELLSRTKVDLLLLASDNADTDAIELCRRIRSQNINCPIIVISHVHSDAEEILAMNSGANGYIRQPSSFNVLIAHIRAQLAYHEQFDDLAHIFASFAFWPSRNLLWSMEGRTIPLTKIETSLLQHLYFASGQSIGRSALLRMVWGLASDVGTRTLDSAVYRLRRKIERDSSHPTILLTQPNGYSLQREDSGRYQL